MKQPSSSRKLLLPLVPAYRLALTLRELRLRTGMEPVNRLRFSGRQHRQSLHWRRGQDTAHHRAR